MTDEKTRPADSEAKEELARAAQEYLRAHMTEKFSLQVLADALHVDKFYLLRVLKAVTGETALVCLNRLRCEEAARLLRETNLTICYIAGEVGYVSAAHFTKVFQRCQGCTPSAYRIGYRAGERG